MQLYQFSSPATLILFEKGNKESDFEPSFQWTKAGCGGWAPELNEHFQGGYFSLEIVLFETDLFITSYNIVGTFPLESFVMLKKFPNNPERWVKFEWSSICRKQLALNSLGPEGVDVAERCSRKWNGFFVAHRHGYGCVVTEVHLTPVRHLHSEQNHDDDQTQQPAKPEKTQNTTFLRAGYSATDKNKINNTCCYKRFLFLRGHLFCMYCILVKIMSWWSALPFHSKRNKMKATEVVVDESASLALLWSDHGQWNEHDEFRMLFSVVKKR